MTLPGEHERVSLSRRRAAPLWAPRPGLPRPARGLPLTVPPPNRAPCSAARTGPPAPGPGAYPRPLTRASRSPHRASAPRATSGLQPPTFAPHMPAPHFPQPLALASPFAPRAYAPSPSPPLSPMVPSFPSLCASPSPSGLPIRGAEDSGGSNPAFLRPRPVVLWSCRWRHTGLQCGPRQLPCTRSLWALRPCPGLPHSQP